MTAEPAELAARAARTHVVVIGGGIGGLVAARECAKVGMRVTLLEAADAVGGAIRRAELDGVVVDAGAESFATKGGHVRALVAELGLADKVVTPAAGGAWLAGIPGVGAAPLPAGGVLGIPANPFQEDVRRILGWSGTWRAYLDRVRPPLTIGHNHSLGKLVSSRMGAKVRDRLVAPVTTGVYSAAPEDVDVDVAAPGLNAALTRVGSLSGAVQVLRDENAARRTTPGAAVEGLDGGMSGLVDALVGDLEKLGARVRTGVAVHEVRRDGDTWTIIAEPHLETFPPAPGAAPNAGPGAAPGAAPNAERGTAPSAAPSAGPGAEPDTAPDADALPTGPANETFSADAVVVAVDETTARRLLASVVPALAATAEAEAPQIEIVTLLLHAPQLDGAPRGTGVLTVPGSHTAKALTHSSVKWRWVADAAGGRHVVRVSFGAQGEPAATAALDDEAATRLAVREASALLGVALDRDAVIASHRARFVQSQPASIIGAAERRAAARDAVHSVPGLAAVGAWLAGTGLAQVIPDATAEADRLRRGLLWH
ncbi:protoporphyrinogen/coproporphyrinogen oxidase [Microbacterium sp. XT11]|uniref:protoporphyrinogen/coproporphyrinogen oxidase n=1 Tax=Microbacterium sp. XT11 TaxID=367477 RepID=UPI000742EFD1|nr:FAD-dependent oxidoreductase [Microbacterium sp. XT11]ALX65817.1 hypothetical protein AB663_000538 [Microbacterium sp. XT11]